MLVTVLALVAVLPFVLVGVLVVRTLRATDRARRRGRVQALVDWLREVTSDDHIISRMAGVPTLAEKRAEREQN